LADHESQMNLFKGHISVEDIDKLKAKIKPIFTCENPDLPANEVDVEKFIIKTIEKEGYLKNKLENYQALIKYAYFSNKLTPEVTIIMSTFVSLKTAKAKFGADEFISSIEDVLKHAAGYIAGEILGSINILTILGFPAIYFLFSKMLIYARTLIPENISDYFEFKETFLGYLKDHPKILKEMEV
jgi:hypothetical protein